MSSPHRRSWIGRHRLLTALVLVAVLLVGGAVVADRIAAHVAAGRIADKLATKAPFVDAPAVSVHGFPFVTQALSGKYRDIEVYANDARLVGPQGRTVNASFRAHLRGARVSSADALNGAVQRLPVDRVDATARVPYGSLDAAANSAVHISKSADGVRVTGSVAVPGAGTLRASADVTFDWTGNAVHAAVNHVTVNGVDLAPAVSRAVQQRLAAPLTLPSLPYHLRVTSVRAESDGLVVTGDATDVVLFAAG